MITIDQAKEHLRVEHDEEDALITSLIASAFRYIENRTGQVFEKREAAVMVVDQLPEGSGGVELDYTPVREVTELAYLDPGGAPAVMMAGDIYVDRRGVYPVIYPAANGVWPEHRRQRGGVQITVSAGYEYLPEDVRAAVLLIVGHLFENREAAVVGSVSSELPMGVEMLLAPYVIHRLG